MSTPLPSFVELMASLGLEQKTSASEQEQSPSPPISPKLESDRAAVSPMKAKSTPALRESAARQRNARFSPYSSSNTSKRRDSISSLSSSSSGGSTSPLREAFGDRSPRLRRARNPLGLNIYGSNSDLPAAMPISSFVRRKTPATTPTSPTFPGDSGSDSLSSNIPMPLMIPVLPSALLPKSAGSETDSFPVTPNDSDSVFAQHRRPPREYKSYSDFSENRHSYNPNLSRFAGVRISTASRYSLNEQYLQRDAALA